MSTEYNWVRGKREQSTTHNMGKRKNIQKLNNCFISVVTAADRKLKSSFETEVKFMLTVHDVLGLIDTGYK